MSNIREIMDNCKAIRERLRNPPNAVKDNGINLRAGRQPPQPIVTEPETPILPVIDYSKVVPFNRTDLTFSSTLEFVAREFNMTPARIREKTRIRAVALPRQIAIWISAKNNMQSLSGMGHYLKMDHTTMIHAKYKIQDMIEAGDPMGLRALDIEERLLANFNRVAVSALSESLLDCKTEQKDGNSGQDAIPEISSVDNFGGSDIFNAEKIPSESEIGG